MCGNAQTSDQGEAGEGPGKRITPAVQTADLPGGLTGEAGRGWGAFGIVRREVVPVSRSRIDLYLPAVLELGWEGEDEPAVGTGPADCDGFTPIRRQKAHSGIAGRIAAGKVAFELHFSAGGRRKVVERALDAVGPCRWGP